MSRIPRPQLMPLVVCVAVLAIGYLAYNTSRYVIHNYQLHQDEAAIRRDIAQLDRDHAQLAAVRDYLKSDEFIEDQARRILGLVHPGETLVVVSGAPAVAGTPAPLAGHTPGAEWWKDLFAQPQATAAP